ncbi:hypothetical protein [Streptomyces sp. NPDC056061]|uniref:hypothetical protein n=1 Tax=Streptomyces sp. NPDC056061 TaxID=3345700 RepID=UPI0035D6F435
MHTWKSRSYYILEPHALWASVENGHIPIETIAERVYSKPYNSLRGCQRDQDHLPNDSVQLYELEPDEDYGEALYEFDLTEVYLGFDREENEAVFKTGITALDYWLSITVSDDPSQVTVPPGHSETADLQGAVFESHYWASRGFTPSLRGILADLIRRGELPRGNYMFRHWW